MSEVVFFRGGPVPNEPSPMLIRELERLLEQAKSGDINSIAYVTTTPAESVRTGWNYGPGMNIAMTAGLAILQHRFLLKTTR